MCIIASMLPQLPLFAYLRACQRHSAWQLLCCVVMLGFFVSMAHASSSYEAPHHNQHSNDEHGNEAVLDVLLDAHVDAHIELEHPEALDNPQLMAELANSSHNHGCHHLLTLAGLPSTAVGTPTPQADKFRLSGLHVLHPLAHSAPLLRPPAQS